MKGRNGHVAQAALAKPFKIPSATMYGALVEGVVVNVHYPDDASNRSKVEMEYDVDVTSVYGLGRFRNLPRVDVAAGVDDADDNVLRAADGTVGDGEWVPDGDSKSKKKPTPRYQSSGDRVLVGFINNNPNRGVIVGVLTHFASRVHTSGQPLKDMNGDTIAGGSKRERIRRTRHRGTEMVIDDKGNVKVIFGKTPNQKGKDTDDKKKLTITIGDLQVVIDNSSSPTKVDFKLKDGNSIASMTKDEFKLGAADEPMVLGNKLASLLTDFINAYNVHQHTGNSGAPTPMIPDAMISKAAEVPNTLSDWAKLSKAKP